MTESARTLGLSVAGNEGRGCSVLEDEPGAKGDSNADGAVTSLSRGQSRSSRAGQPWW